jgi:hypothetical protein
VRQTVFLHRRISRLPRAEIQFFALLRKLFDLLIMARNRFRTGRAFLFSVSLKSDEEPGLNSIEKLVADQTG